MGSAMNKIIAYLTYFIKTIEKYLLEAINRMGGHTYDSLDDLLK